MDGAGVSAETAANAFFVVNLQIQTEHVQCHLGAYTDTAGASQALFLIVNKLLHFMKYIKKIPGQSPG